MVSRPTVCIRLIHISCPQTHVAKVILIMPSTWSKWAYTKGLLFLSKGVKLFKLTLQLIQNAIL